MPDSILILKFPRERYKISAILGQRKLLLYFENSSTLISNVKNQNELNLSKTIALNNIILGAHLCLLTFFDNLNFKNSSFSKMMPNFRRLDTGLFQKGIIAFDKFLWFWVPKNI